MTSAEMDELFTLLRKHKVQSYAGNGITVGFSVYALLDVVNEPEAEMTEEQKKAAAAKERAEEEALLYYSSEG